MARLDMAPGADFNFIYAGSERLFLQNRFDELNLYEFLYSKFSEKANGSKTKMLVFSSDGKNRSVSFMGRQSDADGINEAILGVARRQADTAVASEPTPSVSAYNRVQYEEDELGAPAAASPSVPAPPPQPAEGGTVFVRSMLRDLTIRKATDYLLKAMDLCPDSVVVIDSDVLTGLTRDDDIGWMVSFLGKVRARKWSSDNERAAVVILSETDLSPEGFKCRVSDQRMCDYIFEVLPELIDIPAVSLSIQMPNEDDLRNLVFKRLMESHPKHLYLTEAYTNMLCQAVSESSVTGCRTLWNADKFLRTVLGSGDLSLDNLKNTLSLDSVKKRKTWDDMKGRSAQRLRNEFREMKNRFKPVDDDSPKDPTFCYRTDKEVRIRPPGLPHFVIIGEPGTGKTTMASLMARDFYEQKRLKSDRPVIVNLGERIAAGDASWVYNLFEVEGKNRLIFIDEVESAIKSAKGDFTDVNGTGGSSQLSSALQVFVTKLLSVATDSDSDTIVCIAGYKHGVDHFLRLDSGLSSRFPNTFELGGYEGEVLCAIMENYLSSNYKQVVAPGTRKYIQTMFDDLRAGLEHRDIDGWANARTAETVAEKVHAEFPDTEVLGLDEFGKVSIQVGSSDYQLSKYIGRESAEPLDELRGIGGTEDIVPFLEKIERRAKARVKMPQCMNIALVCHGDNPEGVLKGIARFLVQNNSVSRSSLTYFDYDATMSQWHNYPTLLTKRQFDIGDGSLIVFVKPSDRFTKDGYNLPYNEQTDVIIAEAARISSTSKTKTVLAVIEDAPGWDKISEKYREFARLFTVFDYKVDDPGCKANLVAEQISERGVKVTSDFKDALADSLGGTARLRDIDAAIDSCLEAGVHEFDGDGHLLLGGECVKFFLEESQ